MDNKITVTKGDKFGFKMDIVAESDEMIKSIFSKIPKSYKMRVIKFYNPSEGTVRDMIDVSISFVPNKTTGKVNESGRVRAKQIESKIKELLPAFPITTRILVPSGEYSHTPSFRYASTVNGWV